MVFCGLYPVETSEYDRLKDALEKQMIKKGDTVLIAGFGVGYSYGATIIII